jgi:hypothetical protein
MRPGIKYYARCVACEFSSLISQWVAIFSFIIHDMSPGLQQHTHIAMISQMEQL